MFRCLGAHLLRSPSDVNPGLTRVACWLATAGQTPSAENLGSPTPDFVLAPMTSSRCRSCSHSQRSILSLSWLRLSYSSINQTKNPATASVSRVGKSITRDLVLPAYLGSIRIGLGFMGQVLGRTKAEHIAADRPATTCRLRDRHRRPTRP